MVVEWKGMPPKGIMLNLAILSLMPNPYLQMLPWDWDIDTQISESTLSIIDARWIDMHTGLYVDITGLSETSPDVSPGFVSCKNNHRYKVSDLFPLRETAYEGIIAKVPFGYDKILIEEYNESALVTTTFAG